MLRPGEAYVTRFSGVTPLSGTGNDETFTINVDGTVGSIIDIRSPGRPPRGEHWIDEPQRLPVTAGEVGQVFGVALDGRTPPNVYLTSTAAFGLHRTADGRDWMPGMWGPGGPGAIYKLEASNDYRPRLLASITLDGRPNGGPALGNIAYDKWNSQLFVSDLETGMIHRLGLDGTERGRYDHGTQGRSSFLDVPTGRRGSLPAIAFDPSTRASIDDCPVKPFDSAPECWNFAASNRRIWGVGVHDDNKGKVRLYYAVWSGPDFDPDGWKALSEDEKRNSIWSIGLGPDRSFDPSDVRREFVLPDFFVAQEDIARAGYSRPVSDISFPTCTNQPIMLVSERGGIRNLGVAAEDSFATPHEARVIRYELDETGAWRPVGRYDIGFYHRTKEGPPFINANCAGGAAFGPGYTADGRADLSQPDQFVWITGDSLCSPDGPCNLPAGQATARQTDRVQQASEQQEQGDDSEVHGLQGMRENLIAELAPGAAYARSEQGQQANSAVAVVGINESYLIDTDINVDASGNPIPEEMTRNDATTIGDVAIYQVCRPGYAAEPVQLLPAPPRGAAPPPTWEGHPAELSHAEYASHGADLSHFRWGSHYGWMSHRRWRTHSEYWSNPPRHSRWRTHNEYWSIPDHSRWRTHNEYWSIPSHDEYWSYPPTHSRWRTHHQYFSNPPVPQHPRDLSPRHVRPLSPGHHRDLSPGHRRPLSHGHHTELSPGGHRAPLSPYHNRILSPGGHRPPLSPPGGHDRRLSPGGHRPPLSPPGGHDGHLSPQIPSHRPPLSPQGGHDRRLSPQIPSHNPPLSPPGGHDRRLSPQTPAHRPPLSPAGTHDRHLSTQTPAHRPPMSPGSVHNRVLSPKQTPSGPPTHNRTLSPRQPGTPSGPPTHNHILSPGKTTHPPKGPTTGTHPPRGPKTITHPPKGPRTTSHPPRGPRTTSHPPRGPKTTTHAPRGPRTGSHPPRGPKTTTHPPRGPRTTSHPPRGPRTTSHPPRRSTTTRRPPPRRGSQPDRRKPH